MKKFSCLVKTSITSTFSPKVQTFYNIDLDFEDQSEALELEQVSQINSELVEVHQAETSDITYQ